jgi:transposase-like protein
MSMTNALPATLTEAIRYFSDPDNCLSYLAGRRWPNGVRCPHCGADRPYFDKGRRAWECRNRHPRRKFSVKVGTIFEDSPLGLDKWLPTVWMIANMKNGVSSHEIARSIGVTQKTAWFMLHRIRLAMQDGNGGGKLAGEIEVDETYIGGKARNMNKQQRQKALSGRGRKNAWAGKVPVMGFLRRDAETGQSKIRTLHIDSVRTYRLHAEVSRNVQDGSTVYTDALKSYRNLGLYFDHKTVNHAETYVDGQIHTNGLENYWSLLKRGLRGTYVSVEPFHLFRYLDEQAFRFNNRKDDDAARFELALGGIVGKRITYAKLIAAAERP